MSSIDCLSSEEKKELLAGKTAHGMPAFYIACRQEYDEIIKTFIQTVFAIDCLSSEEKKELLAGKTAHGMPAFYIACRRGYNEIVKILVETMCRCDLTWDMTILEELITGRYSPPALFSAFQNGHSETVKVLLNAILTSPLDSTAK